jgi:predicted PurR-regulated permease PerM
MTKDSEQSFNPETGGLFEMHPGENIAVQPSSPPDHWTFRRVVLGTIVLVLVVLGFWLFYKFYQVIFMLFIAIVIGTVIRPAVTWLHHRGIPRLVGIMLVYLFLLALLIGFMFLLLPLIVKQGTSIAAEVPLYYQSLREWAGNSSNPLILRLGAFLPTSLPALASVQQTGSQVLTSAGQALDYVVMAVNVIFMIIIVLLMSFYWTLDGPRNVQSLLQLVPKERRESISELVSAMETKVGAYIAGEGVLCLFIGILALISYLLIGLPNALVLAFIAGVLEAVPMVGPLLGAVAAGLVALSIAPGKLIWVIVATVIIQQLENILLVPRIMRKAVGVNPFVTLLAFFAFSSLFGIAGALMAVPMAAIIQLLLNRFVFHPSSPEPETSTGRDHASRLRYEAQDLASDLRKQARLGKGGSDLRVKQIDRVMDEIETITTDLDALLAQVHTPGAT